MGLRLEPNELANRGFRYVKVNVNLLLNTSRPAPTDIRPGDLSDLLGRFGIDLIVDRIDNEDSVMELLDHDVRYGQGPLFSLPRPVRAEALQAVPDAPDASANGLTGGTQRTGAMPGAPQTTSPSMAERDSAEPSGEAYASSGAVGFG